MPDSESPCCSACRRTLSSSRSVRNVTNLLRLVFSRGSGGRPMWDRFLMSSCPLLLDVLRNENRPAPARCLRAHRVQQLAPGPGRLFVPLGHPSVNTAPKRRSTLVSSLTRMTPVLLMSLLVAQPCGAQENVLENTSNEEAHLGRRVKAADEARPTSSSWNRQTAVILM